MRTRLKDVAEHAGVSIKTVSNVVNGNPHVRPHTRQRVERALDDLRYRPNLSARSLRASRTGVIALALPELDVPYFAELARHVISRAEDRGWTVLIDQTEGSREREKVVASGIRRELIDGVIFSPLALAASDLAERSDTAPMVLLGERIGGATGESLVADHITVDNVAAAHLATSHLISLGRHRIAAIGAQQISSGVTAHLRMQGYRHGITEAGLAVDSDLVCSVEKYHRADGAAAMERLLALPTPPDAVFCFNDLLALGALRTLLHNGVRVPQDVALVGFDDIAEGHYSTPTLSTIRPDKAQLAASSVAALETRLRQNEPESPPQELIAGHDLVIRESSGHR